jgi:hypothetical protein
MEQWNTSFTYHENIVLNLRDEVDMEEYANVIEERPINSTPNSSEDCTTSETKTNRPNNAPAYEKP